MVRNGSSAGTLRLGGHRLEEARSGPRRAAAMAAAATWLPGAALATGAPRLVRGRGQPELRLLDDVRSVLPMPSTGRGRGPGRRSRSSRRTPPGDPLPLQVRKCARVAAAVAAARLRAAAGLRAASGRAHQGGENSWLLLQQLFTGDPRRRCAERWPRDTVRVDVHLRRRSASMTMSSPCAPATPCADRRHRHATAICAAKGSRRSRTPAALSPHSLRNLVRGLHRLVLRVRIPRTRAGATHTHTEEVLWCTRTWLSTAPEYLSRVCSCMCAQVRRVTTMRTPRAPKRGNTCLWCAKCYVQHSTSPRNRNPANRNHLDICQEKKDRVIEWNSVKHIATSER